MGSLFVDVILSSVSFTLLIGCYGKATMKRIDLIRMQGQGCPLSQQSIYYVLGAILDIVIFI